MLRIISIFIFCAFALIANARTLADFKSDTGYCGLGVYDTWSDSPFMTGELKGNYAVTEGTLAAQRSRFGSNTFGVRIDLDSSFPVSPDTQYIHVMMYKPKSGRTMIVGLGSRRERLGQDPYTEQFWELSDNEILPGRWSDAVFPVRCASGIDIRSLVLVPDCESPHDLLEDFIFYIDDIVISDSPTPRVSNEFYPVSGSKSETLQEKEVYAMKSFGFECQGRRQVLELDGSKPGNMYRDMTSKTFYACPGDVLTPFVTMERDGLQSYLYLDSDMNGFFDSNKGDASEEMKRNECVASGGNGKMNSFRLPIDMPPGMYRVRFKSDSNNSDPEGANIGGNRINENGGMIADAMLCVYDGNCILNDFQLNGEVTAADGRKLNSLKTEADKSFIIRSVPEKGFHNGGVEVKSGFNLTGEQYDRYGNRQYTVWTIDASDFNTDGTFAIPSEKLRGNILFIGKMLED